MANVIIFKAKRLAYYQMKADAKFWDSHWSGLAKEAEWEKAEAGFLGWFEEPFVRYLPKRGRIIEAGCGLGYYVLALGRRGYEIEGVEWSRKAVKLIKCRYPKLKVKTGDVRKLAVKDGHYSGYISLGVVEHSEFGPEEYLREAKRVLSPGGVAFISVPHFNLLRRVKSLFGFYHGDPADLDFYQYAFTEQEIDGFIRQAGFKVIDHFRYDAYKGIKEELPFLRNLLSLARKNLDCPVHDPWSGLAMTKPTFKTRPNKVHLAKRPWWLKLAERFFGHMTMVICVKK